MKEFECFFFDVDGTLLDNHNHTIPSSTLQAIKKLKEKGKKIVIASGRSYKAVMEMDELLAIPWDGYILLNGAVASDEKGKEIFRSTLSHATLEKLEEISNKKGTVLYYLGQEEWLNKEPDTLTIKAFEFFRRDPFQFDVHPLKKEEEASMVLAFEEKTDYEEIREIPELLVLATPYCYADVVQKDVNKAIGMKKLAEAFHIPMEKTMAFGDGINDLQMLQEAGMGIAMGQGVARIKEVADYVTSSVDMDGIAKALIHFGQI